MVERCVFDSTVGCDFSAFAATLRHGWCGTWLHNSHMRWKEEAVPRKSRKSVRIELTEAQKKKIREQTGEDVETVDFTVEEPEQQPPVTPRNSGTFF